MWDKKGGRMTQFDNDSKNWYNGYVKQEFNVTAESLMEKEISDIFSKHYNRMMNDLSQVVGFTPVMKVVISNSIRCLEDDILEIKGDNKNDIQRKQKQS